MLKWSPIMQNICRTKMWLKHVWLKFFSALNPLYLNFSENYGNHFYISKIISNVDSLILKLENFKRFTWFLLWKRVPCVLSKSSKNAILNKYSFFVFDVLEELFLNKHIHECHCFRANKGKEIEENNGIW